MSTFNAITGRIRFCDLSASVHENKLLFMQAVERVLDSGWYILGREVEAFEQEFAAAAGTRFALGVGNGTDAIELSLRALDLGPRDVVITVSHTAVATVAAIERAGAIPALVDIDPHDFTMSPESLERFLAGLPCGIHPRAIVPVHLYGQMANMEAIGDIAKKHGLKIIEDCAQAHGAMLGEKNVGTFGDLAAFSFYPTKNLGAFGDGGAVTVSDDSLYKKLLRLRQYGWESRFISEERGINSRLDELQASLLRIKLPALAHNNQRRRDIASRYDQALSRTKKARPPARREGAWHVYHLYVVTSRQRNELIAHLDAHGIDTAVHYPVPVHLQPAYRRPAVLLPSGGLPTTEEVCGQILSLPLYPEMKEQDVDRVCTALAGFAAGKK